MLGWALWLLVLWLRFEGDRFLFSLREGGWVLMDGVWVCLHELMKVFLWFRIAKMNLLISCKSTS